MCPPLTRELSMQDNPGIILFDPEVILSLIVSFIPLRSRYTYISRTMHRVCRRRSGTGCHDDSDHNSTPKLISPLSLEEVLPPSCQPYRRLVKL